ncbi:MAG: helix-turn-helix domain-containing protein [Frankia sp.]|nr:helix-turn-helix domain-containing protein [Frankia sp.]
MTPPVATDLATEWGSRVRRNREERSLSQRDLAAAAKTTQQTVSRVEAGLFTPTDQLRLRLAKALGVNVVDLFPYPEQVG